MFQMGKKYLSLGKHGLIWEQPFGDQRENKRKRAHDPPFA